MARTAASLLREHDLKGIYADYSSGQPSFYAQCPECGHVNGMYPNLQTAVAQKLCGTCRHERVRQYKRDLEKLGRPVKKRPVSEAVMRVLYEDDLEDESTNNLFRDVAAQYDNNWIMQVMQAIQQEAGADEPCTVSPHHGYDPDDPNSDPNDYDEVDLECEGTEYKAWRTEEAAQEAAKQSVMDLFDESPETLHDILFNKMGDLGDLKEKAADFVIRMDGWAPTLSHYDGEYSETRNGAVYYRTG